MDIKQLAILTLTCALTLGCGGGSKGSSNSSGTTGGGGAATIQGYWLSPCFPIDKDGTSSNIVVGFDKGDNGTPIYGEQYRFYYSGDCSGAIRGTMGLGGAVSYLGKQTQSICTAEKFSASFTIFSIDDKQATSDQITKMKSQLGETRSDKACKYRGNLLFGAESGSGMAVGSPFTPTQEFKKLSISSSNLKMKREQPVIDSLLLEKLKHVQKIVR